jgi:hypothetical protein
MASNFYKTDSEKHFMVGLRIFNSEINCTPKFAGWEDLLKCHLSTPELNLLCGILAGR